MALLDGYQVILSGNLQAETFQNVLYYQIVTEDGSQSAQEIIIAALILDVWPKWIAAMSEDAQLDCFSVQKVFPDPVNAREDVFIGDIGLLTGESLPAMDTALIQKVAQQVGGRGKKGRVYFAGIRELDQEKGRLLDAEGSLLSVLGLQLQTNITGGDGGDYAPAWAVREKVKPFAILSMQQWDEANVLPRIATQRRRRTPVKSFISP